MTIELGISLASLLPWSMKSWLWPWGSPTRAACWAKEAGYEFLQVLPLRGTTGKEQFALPVRYKEDAWNAIYGIWQAFRHQSGAAGMPSGLLDWAFFPDPITCWQIVSGRTGWTGYQISHSFGPFSTLVELCPELEMTPEQVAAKCKADNIGLVLDTEHLARDRRPFGPYHGKKPHPFFPGVNLSEGQEPDRGAIKAVVELVAPHVKAVRVKSVASDSVDWLIVNSLVKAPTRHAKLDFVAEYKPPRHTLFNPSAARRHMATFREAMLNRLQG